MLGNVFKRKSVSKRDDFPLHEHCLEHVLAYVSYNDCLRLRRVSRSVKSLVDAHMTVKNRRRTPATYVSIRLDYTYEFSSLPSFLEQVTLPVSRVAFTRQSTIFNNNPYLPTFLEQRAADVTHLRLNKLEIPVSHTHVFEAFVNLESFECSTVVISTKTLITLDRPLFPTSFQRLKRIVIPADWAFNSNREFNCFVVVKGLLNICTLQELRVHIVLHSIEYWDTDEILDLIRRHAHLQRLELPTRFLAERSHDLIPLLKPSGAQLENVYYKHLSEATREDLYVSCVYSLFADLVPGSPETWMYTEFPFLHKAHLNASPLFNVSVHDLELARWDNLRGLLIKMEDVQYMGECPAALIQFSFENVTRPCLEALVLQVCNRPLRIYGEEMTRSCPNVTYLVLDSVIEGDEFFNGIWRGLPHLQYLEIASCKNLGDDGFFGVSRKKPWVGSFRRQVPLFSTLKHVKYLEITGLWEMDRVTGAILENVLSLMPLRYLRLASNNLKGREGASSAYWDEMFSSPSTRFQSGSFPPSPWEVQSIRRSSVLSLTKGLIATTIEKLDLSNLSLMDATTEELEEISCMFRSRNMV